MAPIEFMRPVTQRAQLFGRAARSAGLLQHLAPRLIGAQHQLAGPPHGLRLGAPKSRRRNSIGRACLRLTARSSIDAGLISKRKPAAARILLRTSLTRVPALSGARVASVNVAGADVAWAVAIIAAQHGIFHLLGAQKRQREMILQMRAQRCLGFAMARAAAAR